MRALHLRYVSEKRVGSKLTDAQEQLCRRAEGWADEVIARAVVLQHMIAAALTS